MQATDYVEKKKGKGIILTKDGARLANATIARNGGNKATAQKAELHENTVGKILNNSGFSLESWVKFYDALIANNLKTA